MNTELPTVPPLAEFLRWISEMPASFQAEPAGFPDGKVPARAVFRDLYETLFKQLPGEEILKSLTPANAGKGERNRLRWGMAACWVFWHPFFRANVKVAKDFCKLFTSDLPDLAGAAPVESLLTDQDRREELARLALAVLRLPFPGETWEEFADRLKQVDSVEHQRVIAAALTKEKRAREDRARREKEVREEMARKAAEEAAAKGTRE